MAPPNNPLDSRCQGYPLAERFEQFLTERKYLKNVTDATLIWYRVAFSNFQRHLPPNTSLTKASLQRLVVTLRDRGVKPVTVNTYITALNAFALWLHRRHWFSGSWSRVLTRA